MHRGNRSSIAAIRRRKCFAATVLLFQEEFKDLSNNSWISDDIFTYTMAVFMLLLLVSIVVVVVCALTYDAELMKSWRKEEEEDHSVKLQKNKRSECVLHGEDACACMGKYAVGAAAAEFTLSLEQDANELWAQQMKPKDNNDEYKENID